jgi:hypothetical protein
MFASQSSGNRLYLERFVETTISETAFAVMEVESKKACHNLATLILKVI